MFKNLTFLSFLFLLLSALQISAQKKDSTAVGQVKGILMDSTQNYVLVSGTVAVYTIRDTTLGYQLSNNFGEFNLKGLPTGVPLKLVATYIGYHTVQKNFTIPRQSNVFDLKVINMNRSSRELQEVVITNTPPPVTLNGDTLEFNAAAFKLDKNAVVDDLLRKLPGVTVWGDGKITVNGKDINNITVDGKPFFGGNVKVATENLPKDAVQKIQIFSQVNENNLLDSTTNINIKLKKGKNFGRFGKLATGYGTGAHYEADAMLNFFNKRTQLGTVAASNNVNKIGSEISQLMENASYKGVGARIDYQSNFQTQGTSQPNQGGFIFQHDFIDNADYFNNNRLKGNYYFRNNTTNSTRNSESIVNIVQGQQLQSNNSSYETGVTSHNFNSSYEKKTKTGEIYLKPVFSIHHNTNNSEGFSSSSDADGRLKSTNTNSGISDDSNKSMTIATGFRKNNSTNNGILTSRYLNLDYTVTLGDQESDQHNRTQFRSLEDASENKHFERTYQKASNFINQRFVFEVGQLRELFLKNRLSKIFELNFENTLNTNSRKRDNLVNDIDSVSREAKLNSSLSLNSSFQSYTDIMRFNFQKHFNKSLPNRYSKTVALNFIPQFQYFYMKHRSEHAFQHISQNDLSFLPKATINYYHNEYGKFSKTYRLEYAQQKEYPSIEQLVPLTDNSNQYYIYVANPDLKPYTTESLRFSLSNYRQEGKHPLNYNFTLKASQIKNTLTDSTSIDDIGRRISSTVNINGNRELSFQGGINKAFKIKDYQIELRTSLYATYLDQPSYINSLLNLSNTFRMGNNLDVQYSFKDVFILKTSYSASSSRAKQKGTQNSIYKASNNTVSLSSSYKMNPRFTVNSNINFQSNQSSQLEDQHFTLWNAGMNYRFLKEKTLEFKFTALDILRQNKGIRNHGDLNGVTRITTNVLQQYFMCTLAYYPRKMGK